MFNRGGLGRAPLLILAVWAALVALGCGGDVKNGVSAGAGGSSNGDASGTGGSAVSSTSSSVADPSRISTSDNNAVATGGYWWTYTDHNDVSSPYHALITPLTSLSVALQPVMDNDPAHATVIRVSGTVPPSWPWSLVAAQDPSTIDWYWQQLYPDSEIPAYPTAGVGFGFSKNNAVFDATRGGNIGIAFDMKINVDVPLVNVAMPMVGTDLPDPNYSDAFPAQCTYYTATRSPGVSGASCFAFHRKTLASASFGGTSAYDTLANVGVWRRYCVLYSEVAPPSWADSATQALIPRFDPTRVVKMLWDMFDPATGTAAAPFDISIDNVSFVTAAQAANPANGCDPSMI